MTQRNNLVPKAQVSKGTKTRILKRQLVKEILDNLIIIYAQTDDKISRIRLQKLRNIDLDVKDWLKWLRVDYRYVVGTYISVKDDDATTEFLEKNENLRSLKL